MERTLRKGLPRFVVFIMWDEVPGSSGDGMVADGRKEREGGNYNEMAGGGQKARFSLVVTV